MTGEYTIKEPGGNVRTVKYHADPHGGFFAHVHNSGGNDHSGGTYGGHGHDNHGHHGHYWVWSTLLWMHFVDWLCILTTLFYCCIAIVVGYKYTRLYIAFITLKK